MTNLAVCRLCLTERDPSFIVLKQDDEFINKIFYFASVEPLPESIDTIIICPDCRLLLTQFEQFREGCIHNDQIFRERLQNDKPVAVVEEKKNGTEVVKVVILDENEAQQLFLIKEVEVRKDIVPAVKIESVKEEVSVSEEANQNVRQTRSRRQTKPTSPKSVASKSNKLQPNAKQDKGAAVGATKKKRSNVAETSNRYLPCVRCGKMIRRSNMRKHMETHDPKPPQLFCSHCGKKFRDPNLLKVHINSNHTFERKYECEECGKVYYRPNSLREHFYAKHSEEKRYECTVCGMKFTNFSKKTYHYIKQHTVATPYSCQYCDKAFKIRSDWTLHVRTHTGEKPFPCDICGKRFNKSYNVVIHKKSHRNDEAKKITVETKPTV